jgi:hypothetical protein
MREPGTRPIVSTNLCSVLGVHIFYWIPNHSHLSCSKFVRCFVWVLNWCVCSFFSDLLNGGIIKPSLLAGITWPAIHRSMRRPFECRPCIPAGLLHRSRVSCPADTKNSSWASLFTFTKYAGWVGRASSLCPRVLVATLVYFELLIWV